MVNITVCYQILNKITKRLTNTFHWLRGNIHVYDVSNIVNMSNVSGIKRVKIGGNKYTKQLCVLHVTLLHPIKFSLLLNPAEQ